MGEKNIPPFMPNLSGLDEKERVDLGLFYDKYARAEWFRGAQLVKNHPMQMKTVLLITCEYTPLNLLGEILSFTEPKGWGIEWRDLSRL